MFPELFVEHCPSSRQIGKKKKRVSGSHHAQQ
jgi:hypothetical protein